jgi:hypothetical protein
MDSFVVVLVATIIASVAGAIYAIRTGGLRSVNADTRTSLALKSGAIIGFVIGLFAGFWCIIAAITGALGAWILSLVFYNRKMS